MSFDSTIGEIEAQQKDLPEYARYLNALSLDPIDSGEPIFVGAGDSLACAQFIERLKNFAPRSMDPYELSQNPLFARDKIVFFISVSGRTRSNIEAARAVEGIAKETVAITANQDSQLAKTCSKTIQLKFRKLPGVTPGTNSFTSSLLACSRMFGSIHAQFDLVPRMARANHWAERHSENAETVHFLATGFLFPIAFYGAAKLPEFLGERAEYQLTEEFSHVNLFSMTKKDLAIILKYGSDPVGAKLCEELNCQGFCAELLDLKEPGTDPLEAAVTYSIYFQYFALNAALRKGLRGPAFLENSVLLEISNKMIYFG
ncbi:MAG TPA: SIS domain-containing protein [Nitrososphaerales archaeon]|nr:SIS domain-containing protein [Nitrososphaerales archaeon]